MNVKIKSTLTGTGICILLLPTIVACNGEQITQVPLTTPTAPVNPFGSASPATSEDLVALISDNPALTTLSDAIGEANLDNTWGRGGPYTIFAPSDRAFDALGAVTRRNLLKDENRALLRQILNYHVVSGQIYANQLQSGQMVTQAGSSVNISANGQQVRVNEAQIVESDLKAANGVVHIVDRLMLPPNIKLTPPSVQGGSQIARRPISRSNRY
jgi:uncharacterized surface protein with fasciclin (FAS1) repeats